MELGRRYLKTMQDQGHSPDRAQLSALGSLARVQTELGNRRPPGKGFARLRRNILGRFAAGTPVRGVYLWGGVGRGKTFLMDLFFDNLPFDDKLRFHFHRLMYRVHSQLKEHSGKIDPIDTVAEGLADRARIICFDEFYVSDIGDAMILGKLLQSLFDRRVCLVATSNIPPDDLYAGGLQRNQFLPAIDFIKKNTETVHVDGALDYRLRVLEQAEIYHSPLDEIAELNLASYFEKIAPDKGSSGQALEILGRNITTRRRADGIAWFDFAELCGGPRSQADYVELARCFQTIIVSQTPILNEAMEDEARRFIALVDELYDRRVNLIVSAAAPIDSLYAGKRLVQEFKRTGSRLNEMQSSQYLARAHMP